MLKKLTICFTGLLILANCAHAIVIRHDVADEEYLKLGETYSASVGYVAGCAATLIDPVWLLTAAHCVEGNEGSIFFARHLDQNYRVDKIIVHPEFSRNNDELFDIALVQLKDPVKDGKPARPYSSTDEVGSAVVFVGRGTYGNGRDGLIRDDGRQRGATNTVSDATEHVIGFRFDAPDTATAQEGISARGDSGGPAFLELDSNLYVIGVSSYQVGNGVEEGHYGVMEYYSRVSSSYAWLKSVLDTTPDPIVADHPLIDAIIANDHEAFSHSTVNDGTLADTWTLTEVFYQSVIHDRVSLAKQLIDHGARFETVVIHNDSLIEFALKAGSKAYFEMLQTAAAGHADLYDESSAILPMYIARYRNEPTVIDGARLLLDQGANIDAQTSSGDTALIVAGWNTQNLDLIRLLVERDANVDIPNNNGDTPVMDAAYLGKVDILEFLLKSGADSTLKNRRGQTAMDLAKEKKNDGAIRALRAYE